MAAAKTPIARVNAAMLKTYRDREVRLVGRYLSTDQKAGTIVITAADGQPVAIAGVANPGVYTSGSYVEVIGTVTGDASVVESRVLPLGDALDIPMYNKAINATLKTGLFPQP